MPTETDIYKRDPEVKLGGVPVIEFLPDYNKVRILDVVLDVLPLPDNPMARRFIPSWQKFENTTCWDESTVMLVRDMAIRLAGGISSRNEGSTGVSKSFSAEVICALTNRSYLRHNYSKNSDIGDTIGRFVPQDEKLSVRFEELLADQTIKGETRRIIEKAEAESRPLTIYESKRIAALEGLDGLTETTPWKWKNGTLTGSMAYGSVFGADEVNLAPGNVVERENSAIERNPMLRLVEHEGEIIRDLTPEEQSIIDNGGIVPGVIGLNSHFWYVAAQNPFGIGGGRVEESEARRNRLQDRIVDALTKKQCEDYLRFLIRGDNPDIVFSGRKFRGKKNVRTHFRDFENIPNVDVLIKWVAEFQHDLEKLVEAQKIGVEKDIQGGSYVYTRRNLLRFLDTIKGAQKTKVDLETLFNTGQVTLNKSWHDLVAEGIYQEYLIGMYKEDRNIVQKLIEQAGIMDMLGQSSNTKSVPGWVNQVQKKGVQVTQGNGEWVLSKLGVSNARIHITRLLQRMVKEGYTTVDNGDTILAKRPVRSVLALYQEMFKEQEEPIASVQTAREE